jgi:hypothetical protein
MLNQAIFNLNPGHDHPQKIHILVDTGYIRSTNQDKAFFSQLKLLEKYIFNETYAKHIHVKFYFYQGLGLKVIDNTFDNSLEPLLTSKGLPKFTEAIEIMSENIIKEKDNVATKPWLFFFVHGFSVENASMPKYESLLKQTQFFSRGFLLSTTIRLDRLNELQPKPPILRVLEDKIEYPLAFVFQQAKLRIETPITQSVSLPSADFFKIWSEVLKK